MIGILRAVETICNTRGRPSFTDEGLSYLSLRGPRESGSVMMQIREHDVLIVPSLFETAGMVAAEAGSQWIATIPIEVGGIPETTNYSENGYLYKAKDDLDQILDSLSTSELRIKGLVAKEWPQQLKSELIASQYAEAFL